MMRAVPSLIAACCWMVAMSPTHAATEEPISLRTPTGELHGSLMLPKDARSHSVALIIAGSGPTDRNGNSAMTQNHSLRLLAEALAGNGVSSVRYDKRGVGESAKALADESKLIFHDLVDDAKAWLALLAADKRFKDVVVIGHSEGATIGLLAAQQSAVRMYVSIAGPALSASQILRSQLAGKLPPELAAQSEQILTSLESGKTVSDVPQPLMVLYRPSVQPYLIDWFKVVPTDEIKKLRVPCLIIQGDTDIQVPVAAAQALHDANPKADLVVVEGMNHVLKLVPSDQAKQLASYRDPSLPIAPTMHQAIVRFVDAHMSR